MRLRGPHTIGGYAAGIAAVLAGAIAAAALAVALALSTMRLPDLRRFETTSDSVLSEDRQVLRTYLTKDGFWRLKTTPQDVPPHYLDMLLAYEDKRFFQHHGVDVAALMRAVYLFLRHGRVRSGASTLTMQVVRLLEGRREGLLGKVHQLLLAIKLERKYSKAQILSMYLTLAPFGGNIEGVRSASLQYFGREPARLTLGEAALLVALPQSPELRRPDLNSVAARAARDWVLNSLARRGALSASAVAEAAAEKLPPSRGIYKFHALHLSDRLHYEEPGRRIITTTIDILLQIELERIAAEFFDQQPDPANIGILVVRNSDLAVRGYIGGGDYFDSDRAGMFDHVRAIRSPGSTLKPFIYALAFDDLIVHPQTIITDDVLRYADYAPENFDRKFRGQVRIRDALIQSLNTVAVMLFNDIGPESFVHRLHDAGVSLELPAAEARPGLPIALGGTGISLESLARLYAALANRGLVGSLRFTADERSGHSSRLFSAESAWAVVNILADMPPPKDRTTLRSRDGHRRLAYKTGTSYGYKDAWAVGFDEAYTVAVWTGRSDALSRPGETGAAAAVPLLYRVFDLLQMAEHDVAHDPPRNSILSATDGLPPRLQYYSHNAPPAIQIQFPVNGSTIRLLYQNQRFSPLTMTATGGNHPYRWYVDGKSAGTEAEDDRLVWTPEGRGEVEVTVIDRNGIRGSSRFWVE